MSRPADHLLRADDIAAGTRRLSELTGLSRLQIETQRLNAQDSLAIETPGERFIYVLGGIGMLTHSSTSDADSLDRIEIATGDFIALAAGERAVVSTDSTLTMLTGSISSS